MKIVERRDNNNLTKEEAKIFKKTKANLEVEEGGTETLDYGTAKPKKKLYESQEFENANTKTYTSQFGIAPPPQKPKTPPSVNEKKKEKIIIEITVKFSEEKSSKTEKEALEYAEESKQWLLKYKMADSVIIRKDKFEYGVKNGSFRKATVHKIIKE